MSGRGSFVAWTLWAALATMHSCTPLTPAFAEGRAARNAPTVAVGPTGSNAGGREAAGALRDALSEELVALGDVRVEPRRRARFVVHGSVTRLERHRVPDGVEVQCEVSLIVSDASGGNVRAMLSGRAGARGSTSPRHLEEVAVQAAVRGALRPLRTQLRSL